MCILFSCFPRSCIGVTDAPESVEFVLSARVSIPRDFDLEDADVKMQAAVADVVAAVMDGRIQ